jgi:hypothetical protein
MKIRAAIESRLNDPTLSAPMIAEIVGASVRYANQVLAGKSCRLCGWYMLGAWRAAERR